MLEEKVRFDAAVSSVLPHTRAPEVEVRCPTRRGPRDGLGHVAARDAPRLNVPHPKHLPLHNAFRTIDASFYYYVTWSAVVVVFFGVDFG